MTLKCVLYLAVTPEMYEKYVEAANKYNAMDYASERNSGFDLFCDTDYTVEQMKTTFVKFGVVAANAVNVAKIRDEGENSVGFWLMPRSSISKTRLMCANSMGLVDKGYRGQLMGATKLDGSHFATVNITAGDRLYQVVPGDAQPWVEVRIVQSVDELPYPHTERGAGGFGSTGK